MSSGVVDSIRAAGGEIYAVTSEPQSLADRARETWELNFQTVGDPHHEISETCRERGWLELFVNEHDRFLRHSGDGLLDWTPEHPKGYFQPGVLVLGKGGRVLYRWRGVPTRRNMGGATERPTAEHAWSHVQEALVTATGDAALDSDPKLDSRGAPWPVFVAALIANGWFIRPRGFAATETGPSVQKRFRRVLVRQLAFAGGWIAAFAYLPTLPVALVLAGWIAWIVPQVQLVNREFQNVKLP